MKDRSSRITKRIFGFLTLGFLTLFLYHLKPTTYTPFSSALSEFSTSLSGLPLTATKTTSTNRPSILFTCPDGRIGLHIVHTRFLIGQSSATPLFVASRLALVRTFLTPSLNAQTSQKFVFYASYDPKLTPSASQAFQDELSKLSAAHTVARPELVPADGNWGLLNFHSIASELSSLDPRVENLDLFVTSRIDADDAAHYKAIEAIQEYACSDGGSENNRGAAAVRVVYLQDGQLWFPSAKDEYGVAGVWKTGKNIDDLYRVLAIMQSMVLSGRDFVGKCAGKLNVYGMRHYQPEDLETIKLDGCKFKFSARKNVLYWHPPKGDIGNLYVRTASSWTRDKADLQYKQQAVDMKAVERSFGVSPAVLASTNLLFADSKRKLQSCWQQRDL